MGLRTGIRNDLDGDDRTSCCVINSIDLNTSLLVVWAFLKFIMSPVKEMTAVIFSEIELLNLT